MWESIRNGLGALVLLHTEKFGLSGQLALEVRPALSDDGRFIAFTSSGALIAGSTGTHAWVAPATDRRGQ